MMTTQDETTTNGTTHPTVGSVVRLDLTKTPPTLDTSPFDTSAPLDPVAAALPVGPVVPAVPVEGARLSVGDVEDQGDEHAAGGAPVLADGHLVPLPAKTWAQRWAEVEAGVRNPVVPAWVRDPRFAAVRAGRAVETAGYGALYHSVRLPWYGLSLTPRACVGAWHLGLDGLDWVRDLDGDPAVTEREIKTHREYELLRSRWARRVMVRLAVAAAVTVTGVVYLGWCAPGWVQVLAAVAAALVAVRAGTPEGEHVVSPAIVREARAILTNSAIVAALEATGIPELRRRLKVEGSTQLFVGLGIREVKPGRYAVDLRLPHGVEATELIEHETRLSGALDRPNDCVIVEPLGLTKTSRHCTMHVLDQPVIRPGVRMPWPLLKGRRRVSVWDPIPVGVDRLGETWKIRLIENNLFVGGLAGQGKSALLRAALAAALMDPICDVGIVAFARSIDYQGLEDLCVHHSVFDAMGDRAAMDAAMDFLRGLHADVSARGERMVRVADLCPDGSITRDAAVKDRGLRPLLVILDEVQILLTDAEHKDEAVKLITGIQRLGRKYGVMLVLATQLVSASEIDLGVLKLCTLRALLKVNDHEAVNKIMGTGTSKVYGTTATHPRGAFMGRDETGAITRKVAAYYISPADLTAVADRVRSVRHDVRSVGITPVPAAVIDPGLEATRTALLTRVVEAVPTALPEWDQTVAWIGLDGGLDTTLRAAHPDEYAERPEGWLTTELRATGVTVRQINRRIERDEPVNGKARGEQVNVLGITLDDARRVLVERLTSENDPA